MEEYGGGAAIAYGGVVYFSNFKDSRVYSVVADSEKGGEPVAVTPGKWYIQPLRFPSLLTISACRGLGVF